MAQTEACSPIPTEILVYMYVYHCLLTSFGKEGIG